MTESNDSSNRSSPPRARRTAQKLELPSPARPQPESPLDDSGESPQRGCSLVFPPSPPSPTRSHSSGSWGSSAGASPSPSAQSSIAGGSERLRPKQWVRKEKIGQGAQGSVYRCEQVATGREVATKVIWTRELSAAAVEAVKREVKTMKRLRHPHLVRYLQATEKKQRELRIYMEYAAGGSLSAHLARHGALPLPLAQRFTRQLCEALQYLHSHGIAHRDIKCANIFLCSKETDAPGDVKLGDFGTFKQVGSESLVGGLKGTPHWMAPEVIRRQHGPDEHETDGWFRADVWSLGCATLEMVTGHSPWQQYSNPLTAMYQIVSSDKTPTIPADVSDDTASFLKLCLQRNPQHRATVTQLLGHPFVRAALDSASKAKTTRRLAKRGKIDTNHTSSKDAVQTQAAAQSSVERASTNSNEHKQPQPQLSMPAPAPVNVNVNVSVLRSSVTELSQPIEGAAAPRDDDDNERERGSSVNLALPQAPVLESAKRKKNKMSPASQRVGQVYSSLADVASPGKIRPTRASRLKPLSVRKQPRELWSSNQETGSPAVAAKTTRSPPVEATPRVPKEPRARGVSAEARSSRLPMLQDLQKGSTHDGLSLSPLRLRRIATAPMPSSSSDDSEDAFPDKLRLPPLSARADQAGSASS